MWLTGYIESIFQPEYPERGQLHPSDFAAARLRWRRHDNQKVQKWYKH